MASSAIAAAAVDLRPRRHQRPPVLERPAVVLRVGQLEAIGAEAGGELDDLADAIEVGAVQHDVDREREAELADDGRRGHLLPHGAHAGDAVGDVVVGVLKGDLDVLEPRLAQLLGPCRASGRRPT